jgi:hypothetical protein
VTAILCALCAFVGLAAALLEARRADLKTTYQRFASRNPKSGLLLTAPRVSPANAGLTTPGPSPSLSASRGPTLEALPLEGEQLAAALALRKAEPMNGSAR